MHNGNKTIENWRIKDNDGEGIETSLAATFDFKPNINMRYGSNNNVHNWRATPINYMLWKTENGGENAMYVNPFANIQLDFPDRVKDWNEEFAELKSTDTIDLLKKSNKMSDRLIEFGHDEYRSRNWNDALNFFSQALGYAEPNTMYEGLAHGNRALCFFQMGIYQKAVIDFEFAMDKNCPEQFLIDVQSTRAECQKLAKKHTQPKVRMPKLHLPDKKFPCMSNNLEIKRNNDFGRCIFAKRDIDVGQTVFVAENFASVITTDNQVYCLACHKIEMNFIGCKNCANVMFCNDDCMNWYNLHKMECRTCYHQIEDCHVKFIIQTLLVAIDIFPNIDSLIKFVEETISDQGCDKIPKTSCDATSKYGIFLKLTPSLKDDYMFRAYQAFACISLIPKVNYLFDTERKQRFLMHLLLQHTIVIPKNAFFDEAQFSDQYTVEYIFDVLSMVNHSCIPNLSFDTVGSKLGHCMAVRPIKKGDQVFINYLGNDVHKPVEQRQKALKGNWGFDCKCDKCEPVEQTPENEAIRADPSFKYVMRNCEIIDDNTKRMQLKKQCIKFLKKYGNLPWSTELDFVIDCFTSL
ncbi:SET and MYND domain-containing protein 4-like isoform X2 [Contarinia nasturtii]|uniref:SET and MYND domain-containing protein 4-like isoform X2 n=1 Tax=Contarinia nasturtii TaxID=265458 RepID=UPI0012D3BC3D|nr:SET and MYND domain-containing protein 4-like isoform X2 [Contarinia nasturtii]